MENAIKSVYMIGGPNGAGKTTVAMELLSNFLTTNEFVNADSIASGLSPLNPDSMAIMAGKLMLNRIENLIEGGKSFAFETTCAGRNHLQTLKKCKQKGYEINILFLFLPNEDIAVDRVKKRVSQGGHSIPEMTIRRRYKSGIKNLLNLYLPVSDNAIICNNSRPLSGNYLTPELIATKQNGLLNIHSQTQWDKMCRWSDL